MGENTGSELQFTRENWGYPLKKKSGLSGLLKVFYSIMVMTEPPPWIVMPLRRDANPF